MSYILDSLTASPSAVYAFRIMVNGYSGYCCKVRNSTSGNEVDVSFDGTEKLSTSSAVTPTTWGSTLGAFMSTDEVTMVTWYDQSGNSYNASNATSSAQPIIASGGSLNTDSGGNLGAEYYSTTQRSLDVTATLSWSQPFTFNQVLDGDTSAANFIRDYSGFNVYMQFSSGFNAYRMGTNVVGSKTYASGDSLALGIHTCKFNGASSYGYLSGTASSVLDLGSQVINDFIIGQAWRGEINEVIAFESAISDTDRRYLETDQADYYTITHADPLYPTGSVTNKTLTASVDVSTSIQRTTNKTLTASVDTSASIQRTTNKNLIANTSVDSSLSRITNKNIVGNTSVDSNFSRSVSKNITANVSVSSEIRRITYRILSCSVDTSGSITRSYLVPKTLTANVGVSTSIDRETTAAGTGNRRRRKFILIN